MGYIAVMNFEDSTYTSNTSDRNKNKIVVEYLKKKKHPLNEEIQKVREIILGRSQRHGGND